jgi:hypothetical protein
MDGWVSMPLAVCASQNTLGKTESESVSQTNATKRAGMAQLKEKYHWEEGR